MSEDRPSGKFKKIGAGWKKNDRIQCSLDDDAVDHFEIYNGKQRFTLYPNTKKSSDKQPDYNIVVLRKGVDEEPKQEARRVYHAPEAVAPSEDLPF